MIRSFPPHQYILVIRLVPVEIPTPKCTGTCKFFDTAHDKTWRLLWYANAQGLSLTPYFIIHWSIYTPPLTIIFVAGI